MFKPCPFCGGSAHAVRQPSGSSVACSACGASTDVASTAEEATKLWHARLQSTMLKDVLADLQASLDAWSKLADALDVPGDLPEDL